MMPLKGGFFEETSHDAGGLSREVVPDVASRRRERAALGGRRAVLECVAPVKKVTVILHIY